MPKKPEHFRQLGPQDQMTCVLMALEGHLSNIQDGITPSDQALDKTQDRLDDLRSLIQWLPKTWD